MTDTAFVALSLLGGRILGPILTVPHNAHQKCHFKVNCPFKFPYKISNLIFERNSCFFKSPRLKSGIRFFREETSGKGRESASEAEARETTLWRAVHRAARPLLRAKCQHATSTVPYIP